MSLKHLWPAEWNKQEAMLITWPSPQSDWKKDIVEIEKTYTEIASVVSEMQKLIIICEDLDHIKPMLSNANRENIRYLEIPTNDTWIRDYGPIITLKNGLKYINDFTFDGWGKQFDAEKDNAVNKQLPNESLCGSKYKLLKHSELILEGGNLENNGQGLLITSLKPWKKEYLKEPFHKMITSRKLKKILGLDKIIWLEDGQIEGDDTGGHIDNLVRFISKDKLAYVQCEDENYPHFESLKEMEKQLHVEFSDSDNEMQLIPVPLPTDVYHKDRRLPASYLNFAFVNGGLIFPVFDSEYDQMVFNKFQELFPSRNIAKIDVRVLLRQNGGLHCATQNIF